MALPFLKAAGKSVEEVEFLIKKFQTELKMAMFLTGCKNIEELKLAPVVVSGYSREWIIERKIPFKSRNIS